MRQLVASIGLCLIGSAAAIYFVGWTAGLCAAMAIAGLGLISDALRK